MRYACLALLVAAMMQATPDFMNRSIGPTMKRMLLAFWMSVCMVPVHSLCAADGWVPGTEELYRLDLLPKFRSAIQVGSVSSYDRTGGNDDGFSGKYSFVSRDDEGLIIADLQGPGIIYRIWTPTPTDDVVEFLFDGESEPRITAKFRDLFSGQVPPFVSPLVGRGAGGFYSYVPLSFQKACKVRVRAERLQFYQINYARYPQDAPITTWERSAWEQSQSAGREGDGGVLGGRIGPQHGRCSSRGGHCVAVEDRVGAVRRRGDVVFDRPAGPYRGPADFAGDGPGRQAAGPAIADHLGWRRASGSSLPGGGLLWLRMGPSGHDLVAGRHA